MTELAVATPPVSKYARLAVIFATIPIAINIVSNLLSRLFDQQLADATTDGAYAVAWFAFLVFFVVTRLAVIVLVVLSFVNASKALREIRTGEFSGKGRVGASIVFGAILLVLVVVSLSSVIGLLVNPGPLV